VVKASGRTQADANFEAEVNTALARLREMVTARQPRISSAELSSYYTRHRRQFWMPERREVEITNRKSAAAAVAVRRAWSARRKVALLAKRYWIERTSPPRHLSPAIRKDELETGPREHAIFSARPGVVTGPVRVRVDYVVFKVMKIEPGRYRSLAEVRGGLGLRLSRVRDQQALAAFIERWRTKWIERTSCSTGYVIQKCKQYRGPRTPESPASFS
ncbi:MAG TPA: peptidylprolyl isomerase, partial [Solirubrobacteraceae bacterium]|nr:peptidylprolyl isomerase [Solirubrobacteraceae bacterium]